MTVNEVETTKYDLIDLISSLSRVPLQHDSKEEALKNITELSKTAMGSEVCTLTWLDPKTGRLTQAACSGFEEGSEEARVSRVVGSISNKGTLDFDRITKGSIVEEYQLQTDGKGIVKIEIAHKYNINSALCYPLRLDNYLIGYLNHFSSSDSKFTDDRKQLIEIFARQAIITIEKFDHRQTTDHALDILAGLSETPLTVSQTESLNQIIAKARELLSVPICILWKTDKAGQKLKIVAASKGVDEDYKKLELDLNSYGIKKHLLSHKVAFLPDVRKPPPSYLYPEKALARGWVSLLSAPLIAEGRLIGLLDVYTNNIRVFTEREKAFFGAFAAQIASNFQQSELIKENEENRNHHTRLSDVIDLIREITETRSVDDLLKLLLNKSLSLVGARKGLISKLDAKGEKLEVVEATDKTSRFRPLKRGEGVSWKALELERPVRVDDVDSTKEFIRFWDDTKSEIAVPIVIGNAEIRVGSEIQRASKPIGVLIVENPHVEAFTQADENDLFTLANHAALMIDRLEADRKLNDLRQIEKEIFSERDYDRIIDAVIRGITSTLSFEYVNISVVKPESNPIRTEHVVGIRKNEVNKFKSLANHSLESDDIQANLIRSGKIEVPEIDDRRFDHRIRKEFRLDQLITVFIPMILFPDKSPIGIVEVGYQRRHRKYIYEQDVQVLKGFVEYAVQAIERKKSGQIDKIRHEFKAPVISIRNNADTLRRRYNNMPSNLLEKRFDDILADCEMLLQQIGELDYILGRSVPPPSEKERIVLFRDIIIKTINQLIKPLARGYGFSVGNIEYKVTDSTRIVVYSDKVKLNRVVYNILTNSLKYAKEDKEAFKMVVEVEEDWQQFVIKFQDWGIGVAKGFEKRIFEEGFRAPEAIRKNVTGSGLGLTIALQAIRSVGGDLILYQNSEPTEFRMVLPKRLTQINSGG